MFQFNVRNNWVLRIMSFVMCLGLLALMTGVPATNAAPLQESTKSAAEAPAMQGDTNYWVKPANNCGDVMMTSDGVALDALAENCTRMGVLGTKAYGSAVIAFVSFPMPDRGNRVQAVFVGNGQDWVWDGTPAPSNLYVRPTGFSGCGPVEMTTDGIHTQAMGVDVRSCVRMGVLGVKGNMVFVSFPMPDRGNAIQVVTLGANWQWDSPTGTTQPPARNCPLPPADIARLDGTWSQDNQRIVFSKAATEHLQGRPGIMINDEATGDWVLINWYQFSELKSNFDSANVCAYAIDHTLIEDANGNGSYQIHQASLPLSFHP